MLFKNKNQYFSLLRNFFSNNAPEIIIMMMGVLFFSYAMSIRNVDVSTDLIGLFSDTDEKAHQTRPIWVSNRSLILTVEDILNTEPNDQIAVEDICRYVLGQYCNDSYRTIVTGFVQRYRNDDKNTIDYCIFEDMSFNFRSEECATLWTSLMWTDTGYARKLVEQHRIFPNMLLNKDIIYLGNLHIGGPLRFDGFDNHRPYSESVVVLQRALNLCLGRNISADGIAGPQTKGALIQFQRRIGLNNLSGVLDLNTLNMLNSCHG